MELLSKLTTPLALLLFTLAFGFWVSNKGRPYNVALFNVHKLLALGAVVLGGLGIYNLLKGAQFAGVIILLLVLAVACGVALFVSGALMSAGKLEYARMRLLHRVGSGGLVLALLLAGVLLVNG